MDIPNIINTCLKEFYINENNELHKVWSYYQNLVRVLEKENMALAHQLSQRNQHIASLQEDIERLSNRRVLVDIQGSLHIFRRNNEGIYVMVPEEPDSDTESDNILNNSEEAEEIARRLGFESDSEYESDDLMTRLMGF
jgi:hypothetical protein